MLLDGPEGRHAASVRRIRSGELVELVDGAGTRAQCTVEAVGKDSLTCLISRVVFEAAPQPQVVVVQALAKGDRSELAVELMTEAGVDVIVPWAATRSIARWDAAKAAKGEQRWASIAREAAKQSRRAWVPEIAALATTAQVADLAGGAQLVLVLHESAARPITSALAPEAGRVVIVVGPEGGLTDDEVNILGSDPVRLGPEVVRTSTAGAIATAVLLSGTRRWLQGAGEWGGHSESDQA